MRVAGASRSLEPAASTSTQSSTDAPSSGQAVARSTSAIPTSNSPWRKPSALNTSRVATGTRGLTITQGSFGRLNGSKVSPTPVMTQAREARQTGTSAPVNFATSIRRASSMAKPFASAHTATDPRCDRQHLVEDEIAEPQIRHAFAEQLRGLEHEVVGGLATVPR